MWPSYDLEAKNSFCLVSPQSNYFLCFVQGRTKGRGATCQVSFSLPFCTMDCLLMQSFCDRQQRFFFFFHDLVLSLSSVIHFSPWVGLRILLTLFLVCFLISSYTSCFITHLCGDTEKKHSLVPTYRYHLMTSKLMIPFIIMTCNILFETTSSSLYLFSVFLPHDFCFHWIT